MTYAFFPFSAVSGCTSLSQGSIVASSLFSPGIGNNYSFSVQIMIALLFSLRELWAGTLTLGTFMDLSRWNFIARSL
jgi:hypothetical protein